LTSAIRLSGATTSRPSTHAASGPFAAGQISPLSPSAVLLLGSFAVPQSRRTLALKIALALLAVALQWAALSTRIAPILDLAAIAYLASLAVAIASVLGYVLKHGRITADKLHGALAGYIMLAILYAFIYALLERATADSFGPAHLEFLEPGTFFHMIYFSLTTLTTTGFGDIVPLTNQARSVVMVEEFTGVFYVGVLIARLAGLYPPTK
jgi:hypothetical protein